MYLAMLGPALVVACVLATWRPAATAVLGCLILAGLLIPMTLRQLQTWRDTDALTGHILALDPNSVIGNQVKAAELARTGHNERAIPFYHAALIRDPDDPMLHLNLGNAFYRVGQYPQAIDEYQKCIADPSEYRVRATLYLGWALIKSGRPDQAESAFRQVLQLDPGNRPARESLDQLSARRVPTP
jgi:Tfp pilus assembly protein PilF